ncbi:MAG: hypothetical protein KDH15_11390 [Rhodocyclaceae bacterium]|nr:hypothetical protein [Rhodocyclaceae bacterium]
MPRQRPSASFACRQARVLCALAVSLSAAAAVADDSVAAVEVTADAAPLVGPGASWRAEMRRLLAPEGAAYMPTSAGERRAISREERHRLREDIRASRDIYELRERSGRDRH